VLGVVTVLQVLDSLGITRAQVKWVNDILIEKAKVGGVLVHIKTQGENVTSALVGIGLNVENTPRVEPTPFVPEVAALKSFVKDPLLCTHGQVFRKLAANLANNYDRFIKGKFSELLAIYRQRSIVLGRTVTVYEDTDADVLRKIAKGKVTAIGDNLELRLEGVRTSVWRGRLVLEGCNRDPKS
jgi:BirA family biotin operon repressor/biotin-[acetyl-CoA-carboxylase] ligase